MHTVTLTATEPDAEGNQIPVSDQDIYLYVPRMFSLLSIAEDSPDEAGQPEVQLPDNLPDDSAGNITLVEMIQDKETYGNI